MEGTRNHRKMRSTYQGQFFVSNSQRGGVIGGFGTSIAQGATTRDVAGTEGLTRGERQGGRNLESRLLLPLSTSEAEGSFGLRESPGQHCLPRCLQTSSIGISIILDQPMRPNQLLLNSSIA